MTRRAAIYARYSSDLQRDASIDDQLRVCRQLIAREGWNEGEVYTDAAISGATMLRPGYQRMLEAARAGRFDVIVAESLDRISRDQEHIAAFYKQTSFCGIPVITRAEGEISELHIGLKGTMSALFLKDLGQKTHRGLEGLINAGKSAGGKSYGYRVVKGTDAQGNPVTGELELVPEEVKVIHRIFVDYAAGKSARAIAAALNQEDVPAPRGGTWSFSTISGNCKRGTGILNNELYIGRRLWNRQRFMKDPLTGKRQARMNPAAGRVIVEVPEFRIIDDDLWAAVKVRQDVLRTVLLRTDGDHRPEQARRPRHLLSGLVTCACCGSSYIIVGQARYGCASARNRGVAVCENRRTISQKELEDRVLGGLREKLMHPDLVSEFVAEYQREQNRLRRERGERLADLQRELAQVEDKIANMITAITDGLYLPSMKASMETLEARKAEIATALAGFSEDPVRLHPKMAAVYERKVGDLIAALNTPDCREEAAEILRGLISEVRAVPEGDSGSGLALELAGDLAGILGLCTNDKALREDRRASSQLTMVAGAGFEPAAFRL